MANNIVSRCLEKDAEAFRLVLKGCDCESAAHLGISISANERSDYAAKLDRLVEAAKWYGEHPGRIDHAPCCSWWDNFGGDDAVPECNCGTQAAQDELAAALEAIKLEEETEDA